MKLLVWLNILFILSNNISILIKAFFTCQAKIEVNASDYNGATPLHYAVTQQLIGCTSILMTAGADPDAEIIEQVRFKFKYKSDIFVL